MPEVILCSVDKAYLGGVELIQGQRDQYNEEENLGKKTELLIRIGSLAPYGMHVDIQF